MQNLPRFLVFERQPTTVRYGLTALVVAVAAAVTWSVPVLGERAIFLLFFVAIAQATLWFGFTAGLLGFLLSMLAVNALFLRASWSSAWADALILDTEFCVFVGFVMVSVLGYRQAAQTLWDNGQDLARAQAVGRIGSWRLNLGRNELSWSDETYRIFGIPAGTPLSYESFLAAVDPADRDSVDRAWRAALRGEPYDIEHRVLVDGEVRWVRERAELEFDRKHRLRGGFGTAQDVTDHKRAETEFRERLQLQTQIANVGASVPGLICSFRLGPDGTATMPYSSHACEDLYGIKPEVIAEDFSPVFSRIHPDDFGQVQTSIADSARSLEPWRAVFRYLHPIKGERWIEGHSQPQREPDGSVLWHGYIQDISERKQAEDSIRESQLRWRQLAETMPNLVWTCNPDGACDYLSTQWAQYTGLPESAQLGFGWLEQVHPDDRDLLMRAWNRAVASRSPYDMEFRIRRHDGLYRWFKTRALPIFDSSGQVVKWYGSNTDIHDLRQAEIALQLSEQFKQAVLDGLPASVAVLDPNGTILAVNRPWLRFAAENRNPSIEGIGVGANYLDTCRRALDSDEGESAAAALTGITGVLRSVTDRFELEYPCHSESVKRWFLMLAVKPPEGFSGAIVTHIDISGRKLAEEKLRERDEELQAIMDSAPALISYLDTDFRYVRANAAYRYWTEQSPRGIRGRQVREVLGDAAWSVVAPYLERAREGERVDYEAAVPYGGREARWVQASYVPRKDAAGKVLGIVVHAIDIEKRKRDAQEIARLNQDLRERLAETQAIFDTAPIGLAIARDPQAREIRGNPELERLLGLPAGAELSKNTAAPPPYRVFRQGRELEVEELPMQIAARGTSDLGSMLEVVREGGESLNLYCSAVPLFDETGRPRGAVGAFLDITPLKKAEQARADSEARLEIILKSADLGSWHWDLRTGHVIFNQRWASMLGYRLDELEPHARTWENLIHPDDADGILQILHAHLSGQAAYYRAEHRLRHKNGSWVWVLTSGQVYARDGEGKPLLAAGVHIDVTREKLAEQERLRLAVVNEATSDLVATADLDGRITYMNAAGRALAGRHADEDLSTTTIADYHPAWAYEIISQQGIPTALERGTWSGEALLLRSDGSEIPVSQVIVTHKDATGRVDMLATVMRDITGQKRLEQTLRDSDERLKAILDAANVIAWDVDLVNETVRSVGPFERFFGLADKTDFDGRNDFLRAIHPEDRDRVAADLDAAARGIRPYRTEFRIPLPRGRERHATAEGALERDAQGTPVRMLGITHDVTERRATEQALRRSEERLRLAQERAGVGVWEWTLADRGLNFTPELEALYGLPPGSVRTYRDWLNLIHADDRARIEFDRDAAIAAHRAFDLEFRIWHTDGRIRWIQAKGGAIYGRGGQPERVFGINMDVTERKQLEENLRRSEERLRLALESSNAGTWSWDVASDVLSWDDLNHALYGFAPDQAVSFQAWIDRVDPEDRDPLVARVQDLLLPGEETVWRDEFRIHHPTKGLRWIAGLGSVERGPHGYPTRFCGINLDITEQKQDRELRERRRRLEESFKIHVASQTAAAIAHELHQPLAAIASYNETALFMLEADQPDRSLLAQTLECSVQQALRAGQVIRQLTALLHQGDTATEALDLNRCVIDAVSLVQADGLIGEFTVTLDLAPDLPKVLASSIQVEKVLVNLLRNGLESMHAGGLESGAIVVETRAMAQDSRPRARVTVRDCGKGLPSGEIARVFNPFFSTKPSGLGMGLAISRALIEAQGGEIWAEPRADGPGASFNFTLPLSV